MYKVRVETGGGEGAIGMLSQLPNHGQMSKDGRYCFYMNGEIDNPDFWIIRNKYIKKPTWNIILISDLNNIKNSLFVQNKNLPNTFLLL